MIAIFRGLKTEGTWFKVAYKDSFTQYQGGICDYGNSYHSTIIVVWFNYILHITISNIFYQVCRRIPKSKDCKEIPWTKYTLAVLFKWVEQPDKLKTNHLTQGDTPIFKPTWSEWQFRITIKGMNYAVRWPTCVSSLCYQLACNFR